MLRKIFSGLIETEGEEACHSICSQWWAHVPVAVLLLYCGAQGAPGWPVYAQYPGVPKQAVVTVPSQHPCVLLLSGRAASTAVTWWSILYSLDFIEIVLCKRIPPPQSTSSCIRPKVIIQSRLGLLQAQN